jgi:hypothetical protein
VLSFLCHAFVIEPRTLASAMRLVEMQDSDTGLWDAFVQRCAEGCVVRSFRNVVRVHFLIHSRYVQLDPELLQHGRSSTRIGRSSSSDFDMYM